MTKKTSKALVPWCDRSQSVVGPPRLPWRVVFPRQPDTTQTMEFAHVEPIPKTDPGGATPNHVESDDERAVRRRVLMKAAATKSRAMMAADLAARTRLTTPTGRDEFDTDEASPISEDVAARLYLRTALLASADLRQACETRQDEMRALGTSNDEVFEILLSLARAHSEASTARSVPVGSLEDVMTAWERGLESSGRK